jgi:hypothetical protein
LTELLFDRIILAKLYFDDYALAQLSRPYRNQKALPSAFLENACAIAASARRTMPLARCSNQQKPLESITHASG